MIKYITSVFFIYFLFGLIFFVFQRKILFNTSGIPKKPKDYELENIKELKIETTDAINLLAWYSKPRINQPLLVYYHGNSFDRFLLQSSTECFGGRYRHRPLK